MDGVGHTYARLLADAGMEEWSFEVLADPGVGYSPHSLGYAAALLLNLCTTVEVWVYPASG